MAETYTGENWEDQHPKPGAMDRRFLKRFQQEGNLARCPDRHANGPNALICWKCWKPLPRKKCSSCGRIQDDSRTICEFCGKSLDTKLGNQK